MTKVKIKCKHCGEWLTEKSSIREEHAQPIKKSKEDTQEYSQLHEAPDVEQYKEERKIEFTGTGFKFLGWVLIYTLLSLLIIPAAWGAVALYRWFIQNLSFSDGTTASFEGRGGQIWAFFAIAMLLGFLPQLSRAVDNPTAALLVLLGLPILLLPISVVIWLKIIRWFVSNTKLSCGTNLNFKGKYLPFLGWNFLLFISFFTIIGWAWVSVAIMRWFCRNIDGGQNHLEFVGSGWGLLWRGFLACLASILIIPIPWVLLWVYRWIIRNMIIKKEALPINKREKVGLIVIAIFATIIVAVIGGFVGKKAWEIVSAPSTPTQQEVETKLIEGLTIGANEINKKAPIMIDNETRLDRATVGPGLRFVYQYTFPNYTSNNIDANWLYKNLQPKVTVAACSEMKSSLEYGVIYVYTYSGNDGVEIARFEIGQKDCGMPYERTGR